MRRYSEDNHLHQAEQACVGVSPARVILQALTAVAMAVVTVLFSLALLSAVAPQAQAAEPDADTQAAMQQLEEAFAEAYAEAQSDGDIAADAVSSLGDAAEATDATDATEEEAAKDGAVSTTSRKNVAAATEEEIADDENPLAASPYASPVNDFAWVLLAIIVAVAGYFVVSTGRLNKNIAQMRHFVD